jgi:hypothetical protein
MAYIVARPRGRFEIRESVHTPKGPRARSLANFADLTDDVLATAGGRASRPFDAEAVRKSARRAGVPIRRRQRAPGAAGTARTPRQFVASSRRMAASLDPSRSAAAAGRRDPGEALIDLLGFVEQVRAFTPDRPAESLGFPPLARVAQETGKRRQATGGQCDT